MILQLRHATFISQSLKENYSGRETGLIDTGPLAPNIPCGSRVMSIFTNWKQPTEMMLSKPSSIKKAVTYASG